MMKRPNARAQSTAAIEPVPLSTPKRPYRSPRLETLGDVRSLTLGGSPGVGDSGDPFNFEPPG